MLTLPIVPYGEPSAGCWSCLKTEHSKILEMFCLTALAPGLAMLQERLDGYHYRSRHSMIVCPGLSISFVCLGFGRWEEVWQSLQHCTNLAVQKVPSRECVASANMSFVPPAKVQCLKTWRKDRWPNWWDSVGVNGPSGSIVILTVSPVKSLSPMRRNDLASISDDFCIVYIHLRRLPDPCWLILL